MSSSGGTGRGRGGKGPATFFLQQLSQFSPRSSSSSHDEQSRGSCSPDLGESMGRIDLSSGSCSPDLDKGISIRDTVYPTFQKLHYSEAEKSYTSGKAKRIAEEVECSLEDLNQSLPDGVSPTPADTTEIFIGAAQNPKKNRVFGIGSLYSPPSVSSRWEAGGSGFPSMGNDDERYQKLQTEYEAEKEQRQALERRTGGLEESHQQLQQSHHQVLDELKQTKLLLERLLRRDTQPDDE